MITQVKFNIIQFVSSKNPIGRRYNFVLKNCKERSHQE